MIGSIRELGKPVDKVGLGNNRIEESCMRMLDAKQVTEQSGTQLSQFSSQECVLTLFEMDFFCAKDTESDAINKTEAL